MLRMAQTGAVMRHTHLSNEKVPGEDIAHPVNDAIQAAEAHQGRYLVQEVAQQLRVDGQQAHRIDQHLSASELGSFNLANLLLFYLIAFTVFKVMQSELQSKLGEGRATIMPILWQPTYH